MIRSVAALVLAVAVAGLGQGHVGGDVLFALAGGARSAGMAGAGLAVADGEGLFLNPAALVGTAGWEALSAYARQFGAADFALVSLAGPGLGVAAMALDAGSIGPGLAFRVEGAVAAVGIPIYGGLSMGTRARLLHPVAPREALGWAVDAGVLWQGPVQVGLVWQGVLSQPAFPGEDWPRTLAVGVAVPFRWGTFLSGIVALDATGLAAGAPALAAGGELWAGDIAVRAGVTANSVSFGVSVRWSSFQLDWAAVAHPVLPAAVRVSLTVRFP
ncbi:hypothetical protein H5T53_00850 [Candidatus Bipolaricaulota bacterium]|nr:hypothetical protein [Candidatus Bipolaricaulota bacterium]